jgi:hypothetical protein
MPDERRFPSQLSFPSLLESTGRICDRFEIGLGSNVAMMGDPIGQTAIGAQDATAPEPVEGFVERVRTEN